MRTHRAGLLTLGLALAVGAPARAADPAALPTLPYYSIQVDTARDRAQALQKLKPFASEPYARAEHRKGGWQVRIGAWKRPGEANRELPHLARLGARTPHRLTMQTNVDWLLPDGSTLKAVAAAPAVAKAAPAAAPAPAEPAPAVAAKSPSPLLPAPPATPIHRTITLDDAFIKSAVQLDTEVRRWLRDHGAVRRDHGLYGLDVARLMYYAAQRGDRALYETLLPDAQQLILDAKEVGPYAAGFVLWRRMAGTKPEVSGATEALWMARALWAGSTAFQRPNDRALALRVLDGYARHAYELQGFWLVRKYFTFDGNAFVNLSSITNYQGDFIADIDREAPLPSLRGVAERSWAMVERARTPAGVLNPVIQPEIGATYVGMNVETYAPSNLTSLEDACEGAAGAVRGAPKAARAVLRFADAASRDDRYGQIHAYFDASTGKPIGDALLSPGGYACLALLALALDDESAVHDFMTPLQAAMEFLGETPQVFEAPLFSAAPALVAAQALGAFTPRP